MSVLRRFVDFCQGYYWHVLLSAAVVTVLAGGVASGLSIDSNLERLLPESAPSVAGLERLKASYDGRIGRLTVVLEGGEAEEMKALADRLGPELEALEDVDRVETTRPTSFFMDYRFLYADYEDLVEVRDRLRKRVRWEKKRANPLFVDLSDEQPPEVDISDIVAQYEGETESGYYTSEEGDRLAVFIFPSFPANDLSRAKELVDRVDETVARVIATGESVDYGLTGRYKKRIDLQTLLTGDLATATGIAAVVLLLFLLFLLRSGPGAVIVLVPLSVGVVWTFAWAEIAFDSLNILTGFLGAIILGLGVDYGIHLYFRYHAYAQRMPTNEALVDTLRTSGRANAFAAWTTMVPLGALLISDFQAFYEFGVIAIGGIALVLLAYAILFPCFVFLFDRFGFHPRRPLSAILVSRWLGDYEPGRARHSKRFGRIARATTGGLVILLLLAVVGLPRVEFNRDFYVLQSTNAPSWRLDEMVNDMLGQSQTPGIVLTDSLEHSREVVEVLKKRKAELPAGRTIDEAVSLQSLLPNRQPDKVEILESLRGEIRDLPKKSRKGELDDYLEELDQVLAAAPITEQSLPIGLREPFQRTEAPPKSVVLIFPAVDLTDIENVNDYVSVIRDLPGIDYPHAYDAVAESMLLYDIIRYVERDSIWMLSITVVGLFLISLFAFRRSRDTFLQFFILGLSLLCAVGWIGLAGVDFNFLNVIILPIWLGLGIDATFHMILDLRHDPHDLRVHLTTGLAVTAAFLTTILGFGSTLVAHHEGLHSLGEIAVWGLGLILVVNLFVQVIRVARRQADRTGPADHIPLGEEEK